MDIPVTAPTKASELEIGANGIERLGLDHRSGEARWSAQRPDRQGRGF
jgi:hypothetical protein